MSLLEGQVAVVAGASRGAGKGIALALGDQGATVYVTGRTTRSSDPPADGAPGTIEDTAEAVTDRGGKAIPVQVDHTDREQVAALAADDDVMTKSGKLLYVADVAKEYGFTDVDGQFVPRFVAEPSP